MLSLNMLCIIIVLLLSVSLYHSIQKKQKILNTIDNKYYESTIIPYLQKINKHKINYDIQHIIINNTLNLEKWIDSPNSELYDTQKNKWKFLLLNYYGKWTTYNNLSYIYSFLHKIKNLKISYLMLLSPHMCTKEYNGWKDHSEMYANFT